MAPIYKSNDLKRKEKTSGCKIQRKTKMVFKLQLKLAWRQLKGRKKIPR